MTMWLIILLFLQFIFVISYNFYDAQFYCRKVTQWEILRLQDCHDSDAQLFIDYEMQYGERSCMHMDVSMCDASESEYITNISAILYRNNGTNTCVYSIAQKRYDDHKKKWYTKEWTYSGAMEYLSNRIERRVIMNRLQYSKDTVQDQVKKTFCVPYVIGGELTPMTSCIEIFN